MDRVIERFYPKKFTAKTGEDIKGQPEFHAASPVQQGKTPNAEHLR